MMKKYSLILFAFLMLGSFQSVAQIQQTVPGQEEKVSLDNFVLNEAVKMYPNPVRDYLSISSSISITRVQIYSLLGELILDRRSNLNRLNLVDLNSGIYMIKIHSNQYSVTKKLIKK